MKLLLENDTGKQLFPLNIKPCKSYRIQNVSK